MQAEKTTVVYFVRHAEPNYSNHNDRLRELSEKGKRDCRLVTEFFREKEIGAVISSPYKRAMDTVKELAEAHGLEIEQREDFRERKIGSGWIEDFTGFARRQWADFSYRLAEGESLREVQKRNITALQQVVERYTGKNVVVGGHGTAICTVLNYYDPTVGYAEFEAMKLKMPWVAVLTFDAAGACTKIETYDLTKGDIATVAVENGSF